MRRLFPRPSHKMAHPRQRLNSLSDNSTPSSDISEGSETYDASSTSHEWQLDGQNAHSLIIDNLDLRLDSLSLDTNSIPEILDNERAQIESFFSGLGTEVYVSSSLANLYEGIRKKDWRLVYTGVPVLLYDKGFARSRTQPRVTFVLAERGTCFALWKDTIDNLSNYKVAGPAFHTMCLSSDHRKVVGFSFDSNEAALELWKSLERLICSPENIAISSPGRKKRSSSKQKRSKHVALPPKSQISHPCQFLHVTKVTAYDTPRFYSLQAFVAPSHRHNDY
ncbi:hypothetical protein ACKWTF_002172 [Chironomus riparius]